MKLQVLKELTNLADSDNIDLDHFIRVLKNLRIEHEGQYDQLVINLVDKTVKGLSFKETTSPEKPKSPKSLKSIRTKHRSRSGINNYDRGRYID